MATPTLTHHVLPGSLGDILVDVRTSTRSLPQPAVLLLHGFKGFKDYAFLPVYAERLARAGFTAVTITVSGAGVDADGNFTRLERFARNGYTRELDDLVAVADALIGGELGTAPPSSIGVVGHSKGGGMALLLAREVGPINAVVTWNSIGRMRRHSDAEIEAWRKHGRIFIAHQRLDIKLPMDFEIVEDFLQHQQARLDLAGAVSTLGRPWLQLHATTDETVAFAEARELADSAGAEHELVAIEGATHTWGTRHPWNGSSPHADEVFSLTTAFLSRHLA